MPVNAIWSWISMTYYVYNNLYLSSQISYYDMAQWHRDAVISLIRAISSNMKHCRISATGACVRKDTSFFQLFVRWLYLPGSIKMCSISAKVIHYWVDFNMKSNRNIPVHVGNTITKAEYNLWKKLKEHGWWNSILLLLFSMNSIYLWRQTTDSRARTKIPNIFKLMERENKTNFSKDLPIYGFWVFFFKKSLQSV